jgi:hypothetical protein
MPNWVFNYLTIDGDEQIVATVREMLNQPFTKQYNDTTYNQETQQWEDKIVEVHYSNPVFAFWNIYKPSDEILDEYFAVHPTVKSSLPVTDPNWWASVEEKRKHHWYDWNITHWGTKWDVAVSDDDKYANTELDFFDGKTNYRFQTAWSPPEDAIARLAWMYPQLTFTLSFEEETGWSGVIVWVNGRIVRSEFHDIPQSHQDWIDRDEEDRCECQIGNDPEYWFEDCPMEDEGFIFDTEAKEWKQKVSNE